MPSGNPFLWYYDETMPCAFTTSIQVSTWKKAPKKGDKITIHRDMDTPCADDVKVFINDELVFEKTAETERQEKEITKNIYDDLKRSKDFIK